MKRKGPTSRKQDQVLVDATEREKRLLAKLLHEGLLQTLSAASILARVVAIRAKDPASVPLPEIDRLQQTIDSAIDEARLSIRQLEPPGSEKTALVAALQDLAGSVNPKCACFFRTDSPGGSQFSSSATLALVRIAQEAVHLALRKPNISKINIVLTACRDVLSLEIQDNGSTPSPAGEDESQSVRMMETHARVARGALAIERTNAGTTVKCTCPASG